jgi:hypothetical protein
MITHPSPTKSEAKAHRERRSPVVVAASVTMASALGVFAPSGAVAAEGGLTNLWSGPKREWATSVRWENDIFGGSDRFYTDGIALGVSHTGPSWLDPLADWLPWGEGRRSVGYDVAQGMFTPDETELRVPDPEDRPYAGILGFGLTLHVEKGNSYHGLKFITGVVGSGSLAEETQDLVHEIVGDEKSQGWDHQLHNEPIFNLAYEYRHRFHIAGKREAWAVQAAPVCGGWLGNMLIQGQGGGFFRVGYNMPDDFGPSLVRGMGFMPPPRREGRSGGSDWGFSIYGATVANLVLHDITLDGNTFKDSPSVDKEYFVPAAGLGVSVGNRRFQAAFTYVLWGKEFKGQDEYSKFGSFALSYFF